MTTLDMVAHYAEREKICRDLAEASGDPGVRAVHERNAREAAQQKGEAIASRRRDQIRKLLA